MKKILAADLFCHANAVADKLPKGRERVCRGYVDERASRGPVPPWKAAVAAEGLRLIEEACLGIDVQPDEAQGRLLLAGQIASRRS